MKKCLSCGEMKELDGFSKHKACKDGLRTQCKKCLSLKQKEYYKKNKDKYSDYFKEYNKKNKEAISVKNKEWRMDNSDILKEKKSNYYKENKEIIDCKNRKYALAHSKKIKEYQKTYRQNNKHNRAKTTKHRYKNDELFKMKVDTRNRINKKFKNYGGKEKSLIEYLGCSIEFYKEYLESKFTEGMTWNNYGEWHIDHIVPLASATTKIELGVLFHYKNTQPLWAEDNLKKGDKLI